MLLLGIKTFPKACTGINIKNFSRSIELSCNLVCFDPSKPSVANYSMKRTGIVLSSGVNQLEEVKTNVFVCQSRSLSLSRVTSKCLIYTLSSLNIIDQLIWEYLAVKSDRRINLTNEIYPLFYVFILFGESAVIRSLNVLGLVY